MQTYQIIILAIIQGLTEFLPISSSGHLVLFPKLLGWPDQGLFLDVAVHVGTLGAVLIYFWRDVLGMITGFFKLLKGEVTPGGKMLLLLVVATIPVVFVGFVLSRYGMSKFRYLEVIAWAMIGWGIVLYIADRFAPMEKTVKDVSGPKAFWVGIAQALALIPGTSRSGICMTAMRFMGFKRDEAARFSFLLSIPAISGAATLNIYEAVKSGAFKTLAAPASIGALVAFVSGFIAINFMLKWLKRSDFTPFVVYRLILGVILLVVAYKL